MIKPVIALYTIDQHIASRKIRALLTNCQVVELKGLSESNIGVILHQTLQRLKVAKGAAPREVCND
jgi:hypothetical protein